MGFVTDLNKKKTFPEAPSYSNKIGLIKSLIALHETEVHNTIQREGLKVNSLILLKEELDLQIQKKKKKKQSKGEDSPSGGERSKAMDFVVKPTFFHD